MAPYDAAPEGSWQHAGKALLGHPKSGSHVVQFYEGEAFLTEVVAHYLAEGLQGGEPLVVIASGPHREAFTARLARSGVDVAAECAAGRLTLLDARETLSRFMVDGLPDASRFDEVLSGVLERSLEAGRGTRVRAYGEMVDLLWQDGLPDAAVQLEELWNDLADEHSFCLLCAYDLGRFGSEADARPFRDVCRAHTHVLPTESYSQIEDPDCRLREVALLQQRARTLEKEVQHREQVERELLEALRLRDDFLGLASHELRTPLTALQLQLHSLHGSTGDAGLQERLARTLRHAERLAVLVDGLLDVSRLSAGPVELELEEVDLARLARDAVERALGMPGGPGSPILVLSEGPVLGSWDRARLEQVLTHLLANALKYGRGHPIEVRVEGLPERARLAVRDEGPGISPEHHDRIFERFERAPSPDHVGGLGLGLWRVRRIAEAHGGSIRVKSEPGRGATFILELPRRREAGR